MVTARVLAMRQADGGVQLRCEHAVPPPVYVLILGALEHEDLGEFGPIVVFSVSLSERHTPQGIEGDVDVELAAGTGEEWERLPLLPPMEVRWKGSHEA